MVPAVAIDVPTDVPAAVADAALTSCQNAIGSGRCVLAVGNDTVRWYATIRIADGEPLRLRIEFRAGSASTAALSEKTLIFSERDDLASRWAAAGLVVAGLVAAEEAAPKKAKPEEPMQPAEAPRPPAVRTASDLHWGIDAGALTGPALQRGTYRLGGFVGGWVASDTGVIAGASLRYANRGGDPTLTWWSISAGIGGRVGSPRGTFNAELMGELVAERMLADATDLSEGREERGGQSRFGGRLSANTTLKIAKGIRFLVGADTTALTPQVDIAVKNVVVGREPPLRFSIVGGLRLEL